MYAIESPFGQRLYHRLGPWQNDDLARFCDALGAMWDNLLEISEETGSDGEAGYIPGYGKIFDVDECPTVFLPYLGRFVGVPVPVGASDAEARTLIHGEAGQARGTRASIESAIERSLDVEANPVPNPSFEYDALGAVPAGLTFPSGYTTKVVEASPSGFPAAGGSKSLRLTTVSDTEERSPTLIVPATAGANLSLRVAFDVQSVTGGKKAVLIIHWLNAKGERISEIGSTALNSMGVHELEVSGIAPAGTVAAQLFICYTAGTAGLFDTYIDEICFGPTGGAYVDGDTPGYVWRGTPGDSVTGKIGSTQFDLLERENPEGEERAWAFTIVVRPEQLVPEGNAAQLEANVNAVKPAGLVMHVIETDEVIIDEGTIPIETASGVIESATLADIT